MTAVTGSVVHELDSVAREMDRLGLLPQDHLAVLCVGSVARGWANSGSDYDLYVVTETPVAIDTVTSGMKSLPVPLVPNTLSTFTTYVEGRRWEIKYWLDSQFDQILDKVGVRAFDEGSTSAAVLTDVEQLGLERLLTCIPMRGQSWVAERQRQVNSSSYRAFATIRSMAGMDSAIEDALGQLECGDTDSAVLSARRAFGHSIDALLESLGCYGSAQPKWRARRFRDELPQLMSYEKYWRLETMQDFDPASPGDWVVSVVEHCGRLALDIEIS